MNKLRIEKRERVRCKDSRRIWIDTQIRRFGGIERTWGGRVSDVKGERYRRDIKTE